MSFQIDLGGCAYEDIVLGVKQHCGWKLEVGPHLPDAKGFQILPRRWVVGRTFGWLGSYRRLARDFERLPETFRTLHFLAFAILMLQAFVKTIAHLL